ncbi:MAG: EAL domain-containing protein [Prochloraceae cyanobacterium]|nr:EAL domain-containing protein [Prochloraceae cyanobacterium]
MTTNILIVEDELLIAKNLSRKLKKFGYSINGIVSSGKEAIAKASSTKPDLILMDIAIKGDMDGIETAAKIREIDDIPVIYLTAYADEETLERAAKTGSYGYLLKPFKEKELHATIKIALSKHQEQVKIKQSLAKDSRKDWMYYDSLTDLPNQLLLRDMFEDILSFGWEQQQDINNRLNTRIAVICLNLDRFGRINDFLGSLNGDLILQIIAQRLSNCIGNNGSIARLNNDEFAIILNPLSGEHSVANYAQNILGELRRPFLIDEREIFMTASLGIACYPFDGQEINKLLCHATKAMKYAKQQGKNQYQFYGEDLEIPTSGDLSIEADLYYALEREEFQIYYQPQINLKTGQIVAAEALLRWFSSKRGVVGPNQFIPIAEESGLINPIGTWVLQEACRQVSAWHRDGLEPIRVSVNLSANQLKQPDLYRIIMQSLSDSKLAPQYLELELTEQILIDDVDINIQRLNQIKKLGIKLALDDFGTGYSSFNYLKQFPFDILKIDKCFVRDINTNPTNDAITKSFIEMSNLLGLRTIAEGIETEAELAILRKHQCDEIQGYLFSPPLPAAEFEKLLSSSKQGIIKAVA